MNDKSSELSEDRFELALAAYAAGIRQPASGLDNAVMARVRSLSPRGRRGFLQWLLAPQRVNVRPIVLAFAASVALLLMWPGRAADTGLASAGTVLVRFELVAPEASTVSLAGSFNSWSQDAIRLVPSAAPGLWTATVPLKVGSHEYLFVVDGQRWIADPTAHAQVADGFGQTNSIIVISPRGVVKS
ncbi:MAG: hypothetical protein EXR93_04395 [Gemmatimonadetes bacterium]|nr:hypothetical protein [Gemmatimonadota bacterium]